MNFPDDDDGDALRRVAETSDLTRAMDIDFAVDVPSELAGEKVAELASQRGYVPVVEFDESSNRWTCYCTMRMLLTYDGVVAAQRELDELSASFGGRADGWGTLGNCET